MPKQHPEPTAATAKYLYAHAFRCAYPDCREPLFRVDPRTSLPHLNSRIAHIHARREGGPRWNAQQSSDQNRHRDNLVLMCEAHASLIDNLATVAAYPPELLRQWKATQIAEFQRVQTGWALGDDTAEMVRKGDGLASISISNSVVDLGGKGGSAPGSGGGGGGAIGPGAIAGDGGSGGDILFATVDLEALKSEGFSGEMDIDVGEGGRGSRLPGELPDDGGDTAIRFKRHDGSVLKELKVKGGAGEKSKLPKGFRELIDPDLAGGLQVTALIPVNNAEIRDGLVYTLGADWRRLAIDQVPADLIINVFCSLRWRELDLSSEGIGFHLFLCTPSGKRIAHQPLIASASCAGDGIAKFILPIGAQVSEGGEHTLQLVSGDYLLAETVFRIDVNSAEPSN